MPDTIHIESVHPDGPGRWAWVIRINNRRPVYGWAATASEALKAARVKAAELRAKKADPQPERRTQR